jgi:hypothetical protein
MPTTTPPPAPRLIPLWLKIAYTAFVAVLVPYYWRAYGPLNFLFFCDVALLLTLPAIWLEHRLLISMQAVAILVGQTVWVVDFVLHLVAGGSPLHMTDYMFDPAYPLFTRGLSSFHGWMPFLLLYLLHRLGYDPRAFRWQAALGVSLLLVCYFFTPPPPAPTPGSVVNVNYVYGIGEQEPQRWMHPHAWVGLLLIGFPLVIYWPTHRLLGRLFGPRAADARRVGSGVPPADAETRGEASVARRRLPTSAPAAPAPPPPVTPPPAAQRTHGTRPPSAARPTSPPPAGRAAAAS